MLTIGAVSMRCTTDRDANMAKIERFAEEAGARRAALVVFPEMAVQGYVTSSGTYTSPETLGQLEMYRRIAETVPGPATDRLTRIAREHSMVIQIGIAERNEVGTKLYNSAAVIGPEGVIGVYRKVHNQNEWPVFLAGDDIVVVDTPIGRIGPFICADIHYPEMLRSMAVMGARILTMTTAYPMDGDDPATDPNGRAYLTHADAAAMASQIWVVQSNQVGRPTDDGTGANYFGHSRIVSPFGEVASTGYEEGLVTAKVDIEGEIARHLAAKGPRMARRRPDLYRALADRRY